MLYIDIYVFKSRYMACTACRITIDKKKGSAVPILKGTEDQHFTWIVLTQELYVSLGLSGTLIKIKLKKYIIIYVGIIVG